MHETALSLNHRIEARAGILDTVGADLGVNELWVRGTQAGGVHAQARIVPGLNAAMTTSALAARPGRGLPLILRQIHRKGFLAPVGRGEVGAPPPQGCSSGTVQPRVGSPLGMFKLKHFGAELRAKHARCRARQHVGQF